MFYNISYSPHTDASELFEAPAHTTALKTHVFYDQVVNVMLKYDVIEPCHRFMNITILEIECEDVSIEVMSAVLNLARVKNVAVPSSMSDSKWKWMH